MWQECLNLAARCHELTGLGYLGADIVLDRFKGPLILEINARPGLNIQIANGVGLSERIRRIDQIHDATATPAERAAIEKETPLRESHVARRGLARPAAGPAARGMRP